MRLAALGERKAVVERSRRARRRSWPTCAAARAGRSILEAARRVYDGADGRRRCRRRRHGSPAVTSTAGGRRAALEGGDGPGGRDRRWPSAVAASPTTAPRPTPWWPCPTARAAGWWPRRSAEARTLAGQGPGPQLDGGRRAIPWSCPPGTWDLVLRTTFVEPAYLEPDASWCAPGGVAGQPAGQRGGLRGEGGLAGGRSGPAAGRRAGTLRAGRAGPGGRGPAGAQATARWRPACGPTGAGCCGWPRTPGSGVPGRLGGGGGVGGPGLWWSRRSRWPGPPVSGGLRGAGWAEATVLLAALEARRAGPGRARSAGHGAVARRGPRPPP